jgi:hypothetical protein
MSAFISLGQAYDPGKRPEWLTKIMQICLRKPFGKLCIEHQDTTKGVFAKTPVTALPLVVFLTGSLTPLSRLLLFYSFLEGIYDCAKKHKKKPKVGNLNVFLNVNEGMCPEAQFLGHDMNLGGGPALAANPKEFMRGLLETIYSIFPILLNEVSQNHSRKKEFHETWMDETLAKEFLDALKQLCKSESMEDINTGLSTCFGKLLSLLDYIRPQHFVVGV